MFLEDQEFIEDGDCDKERNKCNIKEKIHDGFLSSFHAQSCVVYSEILERRR
ncbi:hypothetical protein Hanom_Chr01g00011321 [Helianthus anomalus]